MAELKRKKDQLTTADLAGRAETPNQPVTDVPSNEEWGGPELVRPENREQKLDDQIHEDPIHEDKLATNVEGKLDAKRKGGLAEARTQQRAERAEAGTPPQNTQALFAESEVTELRGRWTNVQSAFVDEPRQAVEEADKLVATVMQRLADGFAGERSSLEKQWDRGDNVSTEDLRVALQRYRSFFDRLLAA
ncbi:MAG TPA: hypothetical protein VFB76_18620 [Candidatus Angelobacter sp.]|nr:hypothetical protein [Candidatus Angelobacter sp.]